MAAGIPISQSFLVWHRTREYDKDSRSCVFRGEKGGKRFGKTMVTACRYWYELTDGFWGQFASTQIPHAKPEDILPTEKYLKTMINFFVSSITSPAGLGPRPPVQSARRAMLSLR